MTRFTQRNQKKQRTISLDVYEINVHELNVYRQSPRSDMYIRLWHVLFMYYNLMAIN